MYVWYIEWMPEVWAILIRDWSIRAGEAYSNESAWMVPGTVDPTED